jgi:hypothetical protein
LATKASHSPSVGPAAARRGFASESEGRLYAETFKLLAILCGFGLAVSLFLAVKCLDLSPGFF